MNNTRRQHYVWRHYLSSWAQENKIWCLRENKIFNPNLMGIAQERDFYRFNGLNDDEIKLIRNLVIEPTNKSYQMMNQGWINTFKNMSDKLLFLQKNFSNEQEKKSLIDLIKNNIEEKLHYRIENISIKYLDSILKEDLKFFEEDSKRAHFCNYIAHQYFRTNKMKSRFLSKIEGYDVDVNKINLDTVWNISKLILSSNLGFNLFIRGNNFRMNLLKNKTRVELITCDQPVINAFATYLPDSEFPEKMELYYPVSPNLAIMISDSDEIPEKDLSEIEVNTYNMKMAESAHSQIYSYSKGELEIYLE